MNHRILFFLSIITIGVGIAGIFLQKQPPEMTEQKEEKKSENDQRLILIAEATHDLQVRDILSPQDYKIASIQVSSTVNDPRDISAIPQGNIRGYLVTSNIQKGSYLMSSQLVAPGSADYSRQSLSMNEMPYTLPIKPRDAYLLSSVHAGDKLALYIRIREVEKGKTESVGLATEEGGSSSSGGQTPKYVLTRLFDRLPVLESQRYKIAKETESRYSNDNQPIGSIVLRVNQQQLAALRTVENVGQLFLLPEDVDQPGMQRVSMDDILPQLHSVKELRGRK